MSELNVKVGDRVVYNSGGMYATDEIAEVIRVTPTGRIKINKSELNFDKYGKEMGKGSPWTPRSYLRELTPELEEEIIEKATIMRCFKEMRNTVRLSYPQAIKILEALGKGDK